MPLGKFLASALAGDTVMLCNWRPCVAMEAPPQEMVSTSTADTTRKRIKAENLRIDTSEFQTAEKGNEQRTGK